MYSLKNKTAIVTGGGSGIGNAICTAFCRTGRESLSCWILMKKDLQKP